MTPRKKTNNLWRWFWEIQLKHIPPLKRLSDGELEIYQTLERSLYETRYTSKWAKFDRYDGVNVKNDIPYV